MLVCFYKNLNLNSDSNFKGQKLEHPIYPGLDVSGVGPVSLPLTQSSVNEIIKICEQAPFGKKEKTIVDKSVRNTWQLSPSHFQFTNPL